jgi:hypothetical protein
MITTLATSQKWGETPGWDHKFLPVIFFTSRIQEGGRFEILGLKIIVFSPSSHEVLNVFISSSLCIPNMFPMCLQLVSQLPSMCSPRYFQQHHTLSHKICPKLNSHNQCSWAKGQHLNNSIQGAQSFYLGKCLRFQNMFFVMGKSKGLNAKQE